MGAYYITRQFSDGVKGGISLSYAEMVRQFRFGSDWKRIRMGISFALNDLRMARSVQSLRFYFGVCCGSVGYLHPSGNTTNYVGHCPLGNNGLYNTSAVSYNINSGNPYISYSSEIGSYMTKVGQTVTASSMGSGGQPSFPFTTGTVQRRCPLILELTKAPTFVTVHAETPQSAGQMSVACKTSEFIEFVESSTTAVNPPVYGTLIQGGSVNMTTALESNGPYDTFNLSFGTNCLELEVYEILAIRLN